MNSIVKRLHHIIPKLLPLSKCLTSLEVFINTFCSAHASMLLCYVVNDNCKLSTVFQVKFKRTNQSYSSSQISHSINIKWCTCDQSSC